MLKKIQHKLKLFFSFSIPFNLLIHKITYFFVSLSHTPAHCR